MLSSFLSSGLSNQSLWRVRSSYLQFTLPGKSFSRPVLAASSGDGRVGSSSPLEGPRRLSKMQCFSTNQSQQQKGNFPSRKRGFLRIRAHWYTLPLSGRSGDLEDGPWQGTGLLSGSPFPQVAGELSPRLSAIGTSLQHPRPLRGGLLKGQCQRLRCWPHHTAPPSLGCRVHPPFLCVSGRSFGGTPCWEVKVGG